MNSSTKNKEQLLVILSRFPYPLDKGDKLRAYHQIKELSNHFDVTVVAITDEEISEARIKKVQEICKQLVLSRINFFTKMSNMLLRLIRMEPLQVGYFFSRATSKKISQLIQQNDFNHIYCQLIRTSEYVKNIHHIPKTIDYMDTLSVGMSRQINRQPFYKKWVYRLEAKRLTKYEQHIFDYFEHKTIISQQDKELIQHPEKDKIVCIPNGIDETFFEATENTEEFDFVFVGNMSYPPNIDAVQYIAERIMPSFEHSTLLISGASPAPSVKELANSNSQIRLTGWVDDIRESYTKGKIFIAPMMIGTGMQNKLLEAMALKIPCVTTPLANNAIGAQHQIEIMVGENANELISCIQELLNDVSRRNEIGEKGSSFVKQKYTWSDSVEKLVELIG
ncbi:MAG TPA: glycosyltransferase [Crocinitomicaceae bacterium]|nr:glycosyltransferase [Crocinitomicaceae bacterium]